MADDPVAAVDLLGELGQRLQAVAGPALAATFGGLLGPPGRLGCFLVLAALAARRIACSNSSSVRCAYQTSNLPIWAKPAIASR